ncbi:MAG: hypothetical protein R3B84_07440 [Zavarzinella sp.]
MFPGMMGMVLATSIALFVAVRFLRNRRLKKHLRRLQQMPIEFWIR